MSTLKLWTVAIAAAALALVLPFLSTSAEAHGNPFYITHYSPDNGYDEPFLVECEDLRRPYVYEGGSSWNLCGASHDTHWVYVKAGTEIKCFQPGGAWPVYWDATGWHDITGFWANGGQHVCVNGLD